MRRAALALVLALALVACAGAQQVIKQDQVTLAWDVVTTDVDGDPLLPDDLVTYTVYIADYRTGGTPIQVGQTTNTELLIVMPYRTNWQLCVSAELDDTESALARSTVTEDVDPTFGTFLVRPRGQPAKPKGERVGG